MWICHILQVAVREHPLIHPVERQRGEEVEREKGGVREVEERGGSER